ncbi:hypothetical protein K3495_g2344 [Podosphaera aphanis]|nr:hypothetical protein K3495_g2344 [Podosphaera aphanis]
MFEKKPTLSTKTRYYSSSKNKAFIAGTESESQSDTSTDSEESFTDDYVHVTRENSCKGPQNLWIADTAASSNMSDNKNVFRSLNSIPQRCIKVGGGKLYTRHAGIAVVNLGGVKFFAKDTLFVPKLGVALFSGKKICGQMNLRGVFDEKKMYFHKNNKSLISASWKSGVYIIDHIATPTIRKNTNDNRNLDSAFNSLETSEIRVPDSAMEIDLTSPVLLPQQLKKSDTNENETLNNATNDDNGDPAYTRPERIKMKRKERYTLWHRRLGHIGKKSLYSLHEVTTLGRPIRIPADIEPCDICLQTKFRKRTSKKLAEHKKEKLALLSADIAGPLPKSLRGYHYFAEMIDNWTRKVWIILLVHKNDIILKLDELAKILERQTEMKIKACRSDNAGELRKILKECKTKYGITSQATSPYTLSQNSPAERAIQTTEDGIRAMLEDAKLPVEFWCYAAQTNAYLRNRLEKGSIIETDIKGIKTSK